jgi:hypothetical protein
MSRAEQYYYNFHYMQIGYAFYLYEIYLTHYSQGEPLGGLEMDGLNSFVYEYIVYLV